MTPEQIEFIRKLISALADVKEFFIDNVNKEDVGANRLYQDMIKNVVNMFRQPNLANLDIWDIEEFLHKAAPSFEVFGLLVSSRNRPTYLGFKFSEGTHPIFWVDTTKQGYRVKTTGLSKNTSFTDHYGKSI